MEGYKVIVNHGLGADDESEVVSRFPDRQHLEAALDYMYGQPKLYVDFRVYRDGDKLEDLRTGFYDQEFRDFLNGYDSVPGTIDHVVLDIALCNEIVAAFEVDIGFEKKLRKLIESVPHFGRDVFSIEITNPDGGLLHRAFGTDKIEPLFENLKTRWNKLGASVVVKIVFSGRDLKRIGAFNREYPKKIDGATFDNTTARTFIVGGLDHLVNRDMATLHVEISGQRFCTREDVFKALSR